MVENQLKKSLVVASAIIAVVGLIINVTFDRDNIYDMTLAGLWLVTLALGFLGAFVGQDKKASMANPTS
jgi:uncharacterized membrane protein (DUF373 family)